MISLAQRQSAFLAAIFDAAPRDATFDVYRRNALANWHDALAAAYPVVLRLVGPAFFREAAARYARAEPSRSGDLHAFGAAFGTFLEGYPHASHLPWLGDVARLEWAVHEAGFAADDPWLDPAALATVPAEASGAVRLRFHAAVRLLRSAHPIVALWEANQADRDGTPARTAGAEAAIVTRAHDGVRAIALGEAEWRFAQAVRGGARLADAAQAMGEEAAVLATLLPRLAAAGAFSAFEL